MYSNRRRPATIFSVPFMAVALTAFSAITPVPVQAQQNSVATTIGIAIPKGNTAVSDSGTMESMGKLLAGGAKEFQLPARPNGPGKADVYFWTDAAYKPGRAPFMQTMIQSALTEAGYTYTKIDPSVDNTPNAFDTDTYDTGWLDEGVTDPRPVYFHATNAKKGQTIVGVWFDQPEKKRLVLGLSTAGFAGGPAETKVPTISDPDAWLVKDLKHASKGLPVPPMPAFPKLAAKPGMVRGMVKDAAGRPVAGAHIIAWTSAAGGFRTDTSGRTNAQGIYELLLPVGISQIVNADCRVNYNGKTLLLPLHPADGEREEFNAKQGAVENFVLRVSGAAGPDGRAYGAAVRLLPHNVPVNSIVEVRMKPVGTLLDGSKGKTLVLRFPIKTSLPEIFFDDIPLGRYELTAKVYDGEDELPLRVRKTFRDGDEDDPVLGNSLSVIFQDQGGNLANLGTSGVRQFEVSLEP